MTFDEYLMMMRNLLLESMRNGAKSKGESESEFVSKYNYFVRTLNFPGYKFDKTNPKEDPNDITEYASWKDITN